MFSGTLPYGECFFMLRNRKCVWIYDRINYLDSNLFAIWFCLYVKDGIEPKISGLRNALCYRFLRAIGEKNLSVFDENRKHLLL